MEPMTALMSIFGGLKGLGGGLLGGGGSSVKVSNTNTAAAVNNLSFSLSGNGQSSNGNVSQPTNATASASDNTPNDSLASPAPLVYGTAPVSNPAAEIGALSGANPAPLGAFDSKQTIIGLAVVAGLGAALLAWKG